MSLSISIGDQIQQEEVIALYAANHWSSAQKPDQLMAALNNSHCLVTARFDGELVGIANSISDGYLVFYFPHLLVHPQYHRQGIGRLIMQEMLTRYKNFHQMMLVADGQAIDFYQALGFSRAGKTEPMWIYAGQDH